MRYPAISPNGEQVAFTYKGNIYVVPSQGGQAKRITPMTGYNFNPVWSPDSKTLAYANDRYGNFDVFTISASGGTPTRVTTNSAKEVPYAFSNDGNTIYFGATIADPAQSALVPKGSMEELYAVPVKGGRYEQVLATPAQFISFSEDGKTFLYQDRKGGENEWRKHHTSSITRDIWLYDTATGKHTQQTQWEGENRNPHFAKDGKSFYYLSEQGGTFNVWQMPIGKASEAKQVTSFKTHPVRFLSAADNGMLCFGYNGEIYTMQEKQQPKKLGIEIVSDDPTGKNNYFSVSSGSYGTVSPDGKMIATISRGELFVTAVDYPTTKRITQTAQSEVAPTFAADNRTIAYASERDGNWNIYTATVVRKDEPNLAYATLIEEKPLFKDNRIDRSYPQYSPDGKELAFVEGRCRLMVLDIKSGKVRQITDGSKHYSTTGYMDYSWSPDGKWFAVSYTGNQHDPYSDIGIVSAKGGEIHNLTNTGYFDESPQWVMGGNAIVFSTDRFGMRSHASWGSQNDIMIVYLNRKSYELARMSKEDYELYKEAEKKAKEEKEKAEKEKAEKEKGKNKDKKADESKKPDEKKTEDIVVELDNIEERIVRLTSRSGSLSGFSMNKEGDKLFYMMSYDGSYDMWQLDLRDRSNKIIFNDVSGSLQWDKKMENMFIFGSKTGKYKGGNGAYTGISIRGEMNMDLAAEREYMFDRIYRQEKERFYHVDMHGVDWNAMRDNYARFLPHINNNFDFAEMASEWLGELNVSHTGCSFSPSYDGNSDITADLGLFYDFTHKGNGLKVSEIIVGGPFDKATSQLKKGDIIEKINGTEITEGMDY
ncbi:MAG: PD40 domain-containing protein, partial [Bacteroidaceae bacterium]|nr:PD40 domain-containing protein [Bacteroidaceae bacterium]